MISWNLNAISCYFQMIALMFCMARYHNEIKNPPGYTLYLCNRLRVQTLSFFVLHKISENVRLMFASVNNSSTTHLFGQYSLLKYCHGHFIRA